MEPRGINQEIIDARMRPNFPIQKRSLKRSVEKHYKIDNSDSDHDFSVSGNDEFIPPSCDSSGSSSSSSSDSENVLQNVLPNIGNPTENNGSNNASPKVKKGKKRIKNPKKWEQNKRKCLRDYGKQYKSARGKLVKEREMGPVCKCRLNCPTKIGNEEMRKKIFTDYLAIGSLQRQRYYLSSCIDVSESRYRRISINVEKPRKPNCIFSFLQEGKKIKVCKPFLMSTLGIKERTLRTVMSGKCTGNGCPPEDKRGKHKNHSKLGEELEESARDHINSVPRIESHYLRAQTTREFIDGGLTIAAMHRNYKSLRHFDNKPAANYNAYHRIFTTQFNIGFHIPKKDQCDLCVSYKNLYEDEKLAQQDDYEKHQEEKELSRIEKAKDIENCKRGGNQIVAIYDLQAVMPVPIGESSSFFYHSKLNCYNFTITDMKSKSTKCFFWHEGIAERGANEIGTCIFRYLKMLETKYPNCDIIFYSDNCCGQQKKPICSEHVPLCCDYT